MSILSIATSLRLDGSFVELMRVNHIVLWFISGVAFMWLGQLWDLHLNDISFVFFHVLAVEAALSFLG